MTQFRIFQRMINMVEAVAADPLAPISSSLEAQQTLQRRRGSVRSEVGGGPTGNNKSKRSTTTGHYETKLLEITLEKITGKHHTLFIFI